MFLLFKRLRRWSTEAGGGGGLVDEGRRRPGTN